MRPKLISTFLALSVCPAAFAFQQSDGGPTATAAIVSSRYCLGTPSANLPMIRRNGKLEPIELYPLDAITLRLQLKVAYRNGGSMPWILPVANQAVVSAGVAPDMLAEVPQPFLGAGSSAADRLPDGDEDAPNKTLFPAIAAGESLNFNNPLESIFVRVYTPSIRSERDLRGKKIYLQMELLSSRWSPRLLTRLAKKWKNYGNLWTDTVRTQLVEIDVPRMPETADCAK
ncbi:MAG: hypothetical protein ABL995_04085 [Bryobacteraceae bacterium]